ncbi:MAG: carbohydrate-binding protein, partial [Terracidiphilus sp.]
MLQLTDRLPRVFRAPAKMVKTAASFLLAVCALSACLNLSAQVSVLTQNADTERDAVYSNETQLTPTSTIHKLFTMSLDDPVMGQALILGGVNVSGYPANILFVTTSPSESAGATSAWAFNADTGAKLWQLSLGTNASFTTATPVLDPNLGPHGALFVVTKDSATNTNSLHAIDVLAGTDLTGSPVTVSASADGISFDSPQENPRAALLDVNGTIYSAYCHMTDSGTYHGWLIGFKYTTNSGFAPNGVWCDTCAAGGNEGGIWQGGDGIVYDGTNIYVETGNGSIGGGDYSMSIVQLSPSALGTVESSWLAPNAQSNSNADLDLDAGGMVIMPGTGGKIFLGPTKYGAMYLVNDANLSAAAIDTYTSGGGVNKSPIAWNSGSAQYAYVWPSGQPIEQFCYAGGGTGSGPCQQSSFTGGGTLALSSTPTGANAILWAYGGGELHAMNPTNVSAADYWNSNQSSGDSTGSGPGALQFLSIGNGKVYVPSGNNLIAYGTPAGSNCTAAPTVPGNLGATTASSSQINLSWTASTATPGCSITYSVYESTTSGFTPSSANQIANNVSGTTYSAAGLAASTTYYYVVEAVDSFGASAASTQVSATTGPGSTTEEPYGGRPAAIPGTVQAENYDTGGQGVAYNVTSVNGTGNSYRSDGVDLEVTTDTGGGYDLGWTAAGQWFKYTVSVATAGTYTVTFRVAAIDAVTDAFHIANTAGTNLTGNINVPATGGWQTWENVTAMVTLPAGTQTLTFDQDNPGWNVNWFSFASSGASCAAVPSAPTLTATTQSSSAIGLTWTEPAPPANCTVTSYNVYGSTTSGFTPESGNLITSVSGTSYTNTGLAASTTYYYVVEALDVFGASAPSNQASATTSGGSSDEDPYGGTPAAIPGTVLAENYDTGGQGVAYNVTSVNGSDNAYRSDGVDLEVAAAPATGNDLGWTAAGQWFRYTVNVTTAGTYTVSFLVAAPTAVTDGFHIANSSGTNLTGPVNVPATGAWQTWTTVTATVTLPAGTQTLTLDQDNAGWNIDSMVFASSGGSGADILDISSGATAASGSYLADEYFSGGA